MKKRIMFNILFLAVYYGAMFVFKPRQLNLDNLVVMPASFTIAYMGLYFYSLYKNKNTIDKSE